MRSILLICFLLIVIPSKAQNNPLEVSHQSAINLWRFELVEMYDFVRPKNKIYDIYTKEEVRGSFTARIIGYQGDIWTVHTIYIAVKPSLTFIISTARNSETIRKNTCLVKFTVISGSTDEDIINGERELNEFENNQGLNLIVTKHSKDIALVFREESTLLYALVIITNDPDKPLSYGFPKSYPIE